MEECLNCLGSKEEYNIKLDDVVPCSLCGGTGETTKETNTNFLSTLQQNIENQSNSWL